MAEERAIGDEAVERAFHVAGDVGIVAFVDQDASRGVRDVQMAEAGEAAGFAHKPFDFCGYILQFGAARGADVESVNGHRRGTESQPGPAASPPLGKPPAIT